MRGALPELARFIGLALLGTSLSAGCREAQSTGTGAIRAAGGEKRIIILNNGDSPFWDACRAGMEEAARDLKLKEVGLRAVFESNDATPQGQIDKLRQFVSQSDIAAIGVSVIDGNNVAIADLMRELRQKGVHVITIDSDVDREHLRDARFAFVGTDNLAGGRELGKCAKGLRPQGGGYATFVGRTGAQNAIERINGFAQGVGEKFKSLDSMPDENDRTRARDNVRNAIRNLKSQGLNTLVGIWSYNAPAIADVVKEMSVRKEFVVVVFDAEPLAIQQMGEGLIDTLVVQNPYQMGYQGVRLMKALFQDDKRVVAEMLPDHGKPQGDIYDTGLKVIVPDTGSPLRPDMFDKKTQFLKLSQFNQWLEKYKLTGS